MRCNMLEPHKIGMSCFRGALHVRCSHVIFGLANLFVNSPHHAPVDTVSSQTNFITCMFTDNGGINRNPSTICIYPWLEFWSCEIERNNALSTLKVTGHDDSLAY